MRVLKWLRLSLLLLTSVSFCFSVTAKADINWLLSNQNTDGSIEQSTDISSQYQSTVETLEALHRLSPTTDVTNALAFVNSSVFTTTEILSRKIIINALYANDTAVLVSQLVSAQNEDSGWGESAGYSSTSIDTAFALQALSAAQYSDPSVISTALAYLYNQQMQNGGFAHSSANISTVYVTAHASIALQQYQFNYDVSNYITAANTYLLDTELVDGGWATHWETATALMAIVPATTDSSIYLSAKNALQASQQTNGSWLNSVGISDVYVTALALRALYLTENIKLPSLPTKGIFTGKVINASTTLPLELATVTITNGVTTNSITTSQDGRFTFKNVEPGDYQFTFTAIGLSNVTRTAGVQAGQQVDMGNTLLSPTLTSAVVQGSVVDANTNLPLAGVNIQIAGTTTVNALTNAVGQYSIQVAPGLVSLSASLTGYVDTTASASISVGEIINFSPKLSTTALSDKTVTLSGRVIDAEDNSAITNATLIISGSSNNQVSSDVNGQFTFEGLTAGLMTLNVVADGYITSAISFIASDGANLTLGDITLTPLTSSNQSTVSGHVYDAISGLPISGAEVSLYGTTQVVFTDNNGAYTLTGINELTFSLYNSASGYLGQTVSVSLTEPTSTVVDINLEPSVTNGISVVKFKTTKANYRSHEDVDIELILGNSSLEAKRIKILIVLKNDNDELVQNLITSNSNVVNLAGGDETYTLLPGTEISLISKWFTSSYPPGTYHLSLKVFDDISNAVLAERQATFTVTPTEEVASLRLKTTPKFISVGEMTQVALSAEFLNKSNINTTLTLLYDFKGTDGMSLQSGQADHVIDVDKTQGALSIVSFPYTFLNDGNYLATLTILSGNVIISELERIIAVAPSVRIEASQTISPQVVVPDRDKRIKINIQLKGVESK